MKNYFLKTWSHVPLKSPWLRSLLPLCVPWNRDWTFWRVCGRTAYSLGPPVKKPPCCIPQLRSGSEEDLRTHIFSPGPLYSRLQIVVQVECRWPCTSPRLVEEMSIYEGADQLIHPIPLSFVGYLHCPDSAPPPPSCLASLAIWACGERVPPQLILALPKWHASLFSILFSNLTPACLVLLGKFYSNHPNHREFMRLLWLLCVCGLSFSIVPPLLSFLGIRSPLDLFFFFLPWGPQVPSSPPSSHTKGKKPCYLPR